jgi:hypothetical protein
VIWHFRHPLGATGIANIFYLTCQLRGLAGGMQDARLLPSAQANKPVYAMAHNLGLGGACVVAVMKRADFWQTGGEDGVQRLGYNQGSEVISRSFSLPLHTVHSFTSHNLRNSVEVLPKLILIKSNRRERFLNTPKPNYKIKIKMSLVNVDDQRS